MLIKNLRFSFQMFDSLHRESVNFTHQKKGYNNSNFNGFNSPKFISIEEKTSKSDNYFGIDFMQKDRGSRLKYKLENSEFDEIVKNSATKWQENCVDKHTKYGFISYKNLSHASVLGFYLLTDMNRIFQMRYCLLL